MKIHTPLPLVPRRAAPTAAMACALSLVLSACTTCPACYGSGIQVGGSIGVVPYITGPVLGSEMGTYTCMSCFGFGIVPGFSQGQPQPPISDPQLATPPVLSPPVIDRPVVDRPVRHRARR